MKPDHKDGLEEQLQQQFKDWEPMPASALFEQMQAKRKPQNKRRKILWLWLFSSAAAIAIMATFIFRFEPNTDATQKMVMQETPNTLVEKPALGQTETKATKSQSTWKTENAQAKTFTKQPLKRVNQLKQPIPIIETPRIVAPNKPQVNEKSNTTITQATIEPPSFKANSFELNLIDTMLKDSHTNSICENVMIPAHLLEATKNKSKANQTQAWWIGINYIQLFGAGILSNNDKSIFQPTQSEAKKQAELTYAAELLAGRRVYKHFYVWSGVQYRSLIYTQVKTFEQNYKENMISSQDMLSIFNQYFDLSYQVISLPIGLTWIEQKEKWQFNALLGMQTHYLLSTSSIQFLPIERSIKRDINSARDERFNRMVLGANAQFGAGRKIYKNLWLNLQIGNSWYQRSFLNPEYYKAERARNLELKLGLQYYF